MVPPLRLVRLYALSAKGGLQAEFGYVGRRPRDRQFTRALDEELARDASVYLLGEDVAAGGAFGVTKGLAQKHGDKRVRNTPISEAAITGLATGAALCGLKPVLEIMFIDFATLAMDCLVNQTAKYRYMSGGQLAVPLVVRTQAGAAGGAGAHERRA